jgi:hypothetical protein
MVFLFSILETVAADLEKQSASQFASDHPQYLDAVRGFRQRGALTKIPVQP